MSSRKIGDLINLLTLGDYTIRASSWILVTGAAIASAYFAFLTNAFKDYSPWILFAAGIGAALILAVIGSPIGYSYRCLAEARLAQALAIEPKSVNPLEDKFAGMQIRLSDFNPPF
jgi:hypothetical protein